MSHFAEIDNNNHVLRVLVGPNYGDEGYQWFVENLGGTWVQTSYNAATNGFRKNYAGIGYTYDESRDAFIAPKANCHAEEVLDEATCIWNCTNEEHTIDRGEI
jgi:hypothetical protein